ncbi:MAG TPA: MoxR family ATPase [Candidatus Thermoplasmatota archaeon]|nr:MoxR family ATPase [Candidatus Thermoplasmatota archaeon]
MADPRPRKAAAAPPPAPTAPPAARDGTTSAGPARPAPAMSLPPPSPVPMVPSPSPAAANPVETARRAIAQVVHGNRDAVDALLVALAAGGHVLLDGIPGVGKTTLARTFAHVTGLHYQRIQLTPDLLPADITGHYFYDQEKRRFILREGPIMAQVVLADEINRTPPRTQAALLEAMQERQVTIEGKTLKLPEPFLMVATKNPVDLEGVYPLPGAELDRFMLSVKLHYPERETEAGMLRGTLVPEPNPPVVGHLAKTLRDAYARTRVHPDLVDYVVDLVTATRSHEDLILGASPRAARQLLEAGRGKAVLRGRLYVTPDDLKSVAGPVLRHRLVLRPEAELAGLTTDQVIADLLEQIPVPIGEDDPAPAASAAPVHRGPANAPTTATTSTSTTAKASAPSAPAPGKRR